LSTNPYIPLVDRAIETVKAEGRPRTTAAVREITDRDPWTLIRAMGDIELLAKRMRDAAIRLRLRDEGPAIPGAAGFEHVSPDELRRDVSLLDRLIAYRKELQAQDNEALRQLEAMRDAAAIEAARVPSDLTGEPAQVGETAA
jgi:hypothetical protein